MENVCLPLYIGTQRAYHVVMGFALCAARFSERKTLMKTLLRALNRASKKHDHIHRTDSGGTPPAEVGSRQEQHRNGGTVRGCDGASVAQVHVVDRPARYGTAYALLRDGAPGAGHGNDRARACEDARSRGDDRLGRDAVDGNATGTPQKAPPCRSKQALPNILTEQKHPLFAYAGRNAAELWLLGAPLSMGEWRDLRYRNLVAGDTVFAGDVARRQAFNDAFEREIARSIAQQSRGEVQS